MRKESIGILAALVIGTACADTGIIDDPPRIDEPGRIDREPIEPPPAGPPARRVRRLTAVQWHDSLVVATEQEWPEWEANAEVLGRPDFSMTTEEGDQLSVVFEGLTLRAARTTCAAAVRADRDAPERDVILGGLDLDAPDPAARLSNLRRLLLRFHGHDVSRDDDDRMAPWRSILEAEVDAGDLGDAHTPADVEAMRWESICIGLATHPDFLTY